METDSTSGEPCRYRKNSRDSCTSIAISKENKEREKETQNDKDSEKKTKDYCTKNSLEKCEKEGDEAKETFETLTFEHSVTFDIKCSERKPWISCIKPLPNGNAIMADFNNCKLYVYNKCQEKQKAIDIPGNPCSLAVTDSDKVAVTLQDKKSIALVNIMTRKVFKHVIAGDCCHGITQNDGNMVVNCLEDGLKFMDLTGNVNKTLPDVTGEAYLCTSENGNIYCSVYWSHKILCFNKDGEEIYSFSNLTMKCPRGISVDDNDQVFTVEFAKNKIHVINSEGTKSRMVLGKKCGINNPLYAMYDSMDAMLYVSNNDGEAVTIFKVS